MSIESVLQNLKNKNIVSLLKQRLKKKTNAAFAYNIWAKTYDEENKKGNVTIFYNDLLIEKMLTETTLQGQVVCDFGTGTGRHYSSLMKLNPKRLFGCDVSSGMLEKLKAKYPDAETHLISDHELNFVKDSEVDIIFSSLTIGHINHLEKYLTEWNRILKPSGEILLTFFHEEFANLKTARSFKTAEGKLFIIESYKHEIAKMKKMFSSLNWDTLFFKEESIDERVEPLLKKINALHVYQNIKTKKIVGGFILKKKP